MLTNLLTDDLPGTKRLFVDLLGFAVEYESEWFISMVEPSGGKLGAMQRTSEFVPEAYQKATQGVMVTVIVDDVDNCFAKARAAGLRIIEAPRNLPYGQRRLLLADPSGALVDISSPVAPLDPGYV